VDDKISSGNITTAVQLLPQTFAGINIADLRVCAIFRALCWLYTINLKRFAVLMFCDIT